MSTEENKQLVLNFLEEVFNQRNVAAIPNYFVEGSFLAGSLANWVHAVSESFPDFEVVIEEVIAEADKVVVYLTLRGTNTGSLFGHPPTGKYVHISSIRIYKLKNCKITSEVNESNMLMLYQQLGITPVIEPA
jgi:steroid delta-isomerase-like uncharacterized protein